MEKIKPIIKKALVPFIVIVIILLTIRPYIPSVANPFRGKDTYSIVGSAIVDECVVSNVLQVKITDFKFVHNSAKVNNLRLEEDLNLGDILILNFSDDVSAIKNKQQVETVCNYDGVEFFDCSVPSIIK